MNKKEIILKTIEFTKKTMGKEGTGHDWWHVERVWKMSKRIAKQEKNVDIFIVELAALLHDIADWKFHKGDMQACSKTARLWLKSQNVDETIIASVCYILDNVSFKGAGAKAEMKSKEGMIVQDSDRLDAIGAIGIARCVAYGGKLEREIHNPTILPVHHKSFEEYKNIKGTTISHFYEKLLLLKDRMNTKTGRRIAEHRHKFMEEYLDEFYKEWYGKD